MTYSGFKGITLRGGILNVLDTDPPFSNQSSRFNTRGYDDQWSNPLGRTYTVAASDTF